MEEQMYAWSQLRDVGVTLQTLAGVERIVAGESYELHLDGVTPGLRELLAHEGFDLDKPIMISKAPPPVIDAYIFRQ